MRKITYAAIALAAAVSFSGIARADEYISNENKEAYAVAAQSAATATQTVLPLGYAQAESPRAAQVNAIFTTPRSNDSLQLQLGDRGIGTN